MTNLRPLSYLGVDSPNPPKVIIATRAPVATDYNGYKIGDIWVNTTAVTSYILLSKAGGSSVWGITTPGASDVDTINALAPLLGNIVIAGGTNLTDVNGGNTVTLNLDDAIVLATSVSSPLYTSVAADLAITAPAGQDILIQMGDAAGANKVSFLDSASAEVFAIDSNGTLGAFAGLTVTGIFTQTAGAVNIGQNNAADAINIGGGNVARAITLASTGAHTLAIGSVAAGAITVDTAAGISLDGATASNFTVTGAAQDLTLRSTGGSVNVIATEAAADAIRLNASDAAGGIDVDCGTNGLALDTTGAMSLDAAAASNISVSGAGVDLNLESAAGRVVVNGEEAAADAVRILSAAGGLDANVALQMNLDSAQAAATAVRIVASAGAGGIDIDSGTGGITIDSAGVLSLDSAGITNLTVTGAFDLTAQSTLGSVIVSGGEAAADAVQITASDAAAGGILLTSGIGGIASNAVGAAAPITLDAVGVVEINSSGAAIGIGNDADNFALNLGIAGVRTVTLGSGTGASSTVVNSGTGAASFGANATDHTTTIGSTTGVSATVLQSGTGKITMTGTVPNMVADFVDVSGTKVTFTQSPILQSNLTTGVVPTGGAGDVNIVSLQNGVLMEEFIIGTQTIICPRMDANGLLTSLDLTATDGVEFNFGAARANSKHSFTIGTSPAFYLQWRFRVADVSGLEPCYIGFRKTQANDAAIANYTDFVAYGPNDAISPGDCAISTQLNTGGLTNTDTNDAFADGSTHTLRINVSAAGVVTFLFDGAPPTVTQAFTFDNADVVHPFWRHTFNAAAPGAIEWISMECGNQ